MVLLQEWREKHEFGEVESGKGKHTHKINTAEQKCPLPGQSDLEWLLFSVSTSEWNSTRLFCVEESSDWQPVDGFLDESKQKNQSTE